METAFAAPDARVLGYGVGLSWDVTPLLALGTRVAAARQGAEAVDLEIAWQEWGVAQEARLRAARSLYLSQQVAVAHQAEASWAARLASLHEARAAGAVTELAVAEAERSRARWKLITLDLRRAAVDQGAALARVLALDPRDLPTIQGAWRPAIADEDLDALLDALPERRLDVRGMEEAAGSHDTALRAAHLAAFPAIELSGQFRQETDRTQVAGATLSVRFPLLDRQQGAIAAEAGQRDRLKEELAARLQGARADTIGAKQAIDLLDREVRAADEAAAAADHLTQLSQRAQAAGALSASVAADRQDQAFEARLRALQLRQQRAEAWITLSIASGAL